MKLLRKNSNRLDSNRIQKEEPALLPAALLLRGLVLSAPDASAVFCVACICRQAVRIKTRLCKELGHQLKC